MFGGFLSLIDIIDFTLNSSNNNVEIFFLECPKPTQWRFPLGRTAVSLGFRDVEHCPQIQFNF